MILAANVVREVRALATEHPDFIYEPPGGQAGCKYIHRDSAGREEPGCIVGHALYRLGHIVPEGLEGNWARTLINKMNETEDDVYPALNLWLNEAQEAQDAGAPWGQAVVLADKAVDLS